MPPSLKPLSECRLYAFVDTAYLHHRSHLDVARDLVQGGADIIQLRAKNSTSAEIERMARDILPLTDAAGIPLVINDYPEIAMRIGAGLFHLGQEDLAAGQGRARQDACRFGLSTHSPSDMDRALAFRPAYVAVGPVYATPTKPGRPPVGLEYVEWAAARMKTETIPWFAIGGISLGNLPDVVEAGARRICVVSAILNAPDIAKACQEFRKHLTSIPLS